MCESGCDCRIFFTIPFFSVKNEVKALCREPKIETCKDNVNTLHCFTCTMYITYGS